MSQKTNNAQFTKFLTATICIFFSIAVLIPIIPQYVHSILLANDLAVGTAMAMQAIGAISARMVVGNIIAKRGTQAAMILGSYICTLGGLIYFLPSSLLTIEIARLIQGVGEGFVFTAGTTWVLSTAPQDKRGQMVALFGLSLWLGSTFAPPLGAFAIHHFGFNAAWAISTFAAVLGVILTRQNKQVHIPSTEKIKFEFIPRESIRPGLTLCLASSGFVAIATFSTLLFHSKGWPGGALAISAFGMGFVAMRFFGGKILDRINIKIVAGYSALLEAFGLLGIALAGGPHVVIFCSFVAGLGMALMYPALAIAAVHGVKLHRQGTVIGWYTAFWDLSILSSNIFFGWLACVLGYSAVFSAAVIGALLSVIFVLTWRNTINHLSKQDKVFESI